MAQPAIGVLWKRGVTRLVVVNRTLERAQVLASHWQAEATTYEHLEHLLASADILISSTGAPHFMVSAQMVAKALQLRSGRPLVLIDIAVPRDIDPDVARLPGVHLYDMDSLGNQVEDSRLQRLTEAPRAIGILEHELTRSAEYLQLVGMHPLVADMGQQADMLCRAELEKTLRRLPDLTEAPLHRIDLVTQALVKKLLEAPRRSVA
jgi:glutamyl-tRNA reductase